MSAELSRRGLLVVAGLGALLLAPASRAAASPAVLARTATILAGGFGTP